MKSGGKVKIIACIVLGVGAFFLFAWITQLLWNWLVPSLFAGPIITFWQSLGLLVLTKILLAGFGGKCSKCGHRHYEPHWKSKFRQKFEGMSAEEKEAFKQKMREKWCSPPKPE